MNRPLRLLPLLLAGVPLAAQNIPPQTSREAVLAVAATLARPPAAPAVSAAINPFRPPAANLRWEDEAPAGRRGDLSEADLLEALAAQIQPTGSLMLGGEPYLLFTERRQKIGDKVPVVLDKVEYTVEIVSIAGNRFRIRYNGREAERPIK